MQEALEHDCDSASKIKNLMKSFAYLATSLKTTWIRAVCFDYLEVEDIMTTKTSGADRMRGRIGHYFRNDFLSTFLISLFVEWYI